MTGVLVTVRYGDTYLSYHCSAETAENTQLNWREMLGRMPHQRTGSINISTDNAYAMIAWSSVHSITVMNDSTPGA